MKKKRVNVSAEKYNNFAFIEFRFNKILLSIRGNKRLPRSSDLKPCDFFYWGQAYPMLLQNF